MFGKLINYEVVNNEVIVNYENKKSFIKIISSDIINFFCTVI